MKINRYLADIEVYEAGKPIEMVVREFGIEESEIIKLASNENPLGTSPNVAREICRNSKKAHLYPDDSMYELKKALSNRFDIESSNLILGAGSDQVIEFVSHVLLHPGSSILTSAVSFAMYDIYAKQFGASVHKTKSYRHVPEEFIEAIEMHRPELVYICTPNNPTGDAVTAEEIKYIIESVKHCDTFFVIDGAYMEYAAARDKRFEIKPSDFTVYGNVLYTGTFSKAYGLGGMRVGYGIADSATIENLHKVRPPFNIGTLSLIASRAALDDREYLRETLRVHREQMNRYERFAVSNGIEYIKSYTNFITYMLDDKDIKSGDIVMDLLKKGIIIRDLATYGMNAVRITIGNQEQNDKFFRIMDSVLRS